MEKERADYIRCIRQEGGDAAGRARALAAIDSSDVLAHGKPVPFSFVPTLLDSDDMAFYESVAETTATVLGKVITRYLENPCYRALFNFPPEIERLILLPCGYDQLLPLARIDLFVDEHDKSFKFCEFNADGAAGMSRDRAIGAELEKTASFKRFSAARRSVRPFELIDSWVAAFLRIWESDPLSARRPVPTVAITDFEESAVMSDFTMFIEAFERAGVHARFVDTRAFAFDGQDLRDEADGTRIDAVYRRAVTSEICTKIDKCGALIDAVAASRVCLIGHFRTNVIHTKMVNVALFDKSREDFLSADEIAFVDAHVCRTYRLETGAVDLGEVKAAREKWIVKPADDYGGNGVFAGVDFTDAQWAGVVDAHLDSGFIVQEFYPPHHVDIVRPEQDAHDPCPVESWESMPGFYLYDGRLAGFYHRLGHGGVIAIGDAGGICAPTFGVDLD